jgi:DNA-binding SARP family transcriptional activator
MEFQLLGDLQASHEGRRIALGGHRQRCVLAVLLLDPGRVVPVDRIVARAWPADSPETAAELVTSYVSRLRKTLGGTGQIDLVSRRPGYLAQIDRELIDAHRFSRMVRQARRDREGLDSERAAARLRGVLGCRQIGHRLGQADALTLIVSVQRAMGRLQDADESYRQALDIYQQIDSDL